MAYSAALNTVYNHYLKTYSQARTSRYDTHKKGELRRIYNSIVEQNRKSPLFLLDNSKETHEFAISLKENARDLRNTIASLGGLDENEILNKKAAFSSDPEIVNVNFIGESDNVSDAPLFDIFVKRLATGQVNTGNMLASNGAVALPVGAYSFDVSLNETNFEFQFNINEGETNIDLQDRLARLFKNADLGLTAKVTEDNGYSALILEATNTGKTINHDFQFTISDEKTSKSAGAVTYFGLDKITREAGDAEFLLNGEPKSAHSNHFTVEKMYELNLTGTSYENSPAVKVGLKTSTESISENISNLVGGYNSFLESALNFSEENSKSRLILSEMRGIARLYEEEIAHLGLSINDDGLLNVTDYAKLGESLTQEPGGEDLVSTNAGLQTLKSFTNAILRKSNQITLNPMEYVDKKIVAYKNPSRSFVNPYMTSAYSGMMFNGYC
ncbi:MAG: flagellar capping protein [Lachnospiraceae bacterium]|nr:flagellar capping protein [Lachnospiraceae bacterium]